MKKAVAYIILVAYSLMLMRPAMPFVADILAHTFWYSQHIATVHFENGKYHVHYQVMDESKKSFPEKDQRSIKSETSTSDHLITALEFNFSFPVLDKKRFVNLLVHLPQPDSWGNYPPPKI
jgi:hypothetical protein